jgi:hypothetical protein
MRAHQIGHEPGMAAPDAASSLNPQEESAPAAQAAQSREQNEQAHCATGAGADKAFRELRAEFARRGLVLDRNSSGLVIGRWNLFQYQADLESVERFLRRAAP